MSPHTTEGVTSAPPSAEDQKLSEGAPPQGASGGGPPDASVDADPPAGDQTTPADSTEQAPASPFDRKALPGYVADRLAKMAGEGDVDKLNTEEETKPGAAPAADKAPASTKPKGEVEQAYPDTLDKDLPPAARIAFAKGRKALREATAKLKEVELDAEDGRSFNEFLTTERLIDDFQAVQNPELAEVIRVRAAMNRACTAYDRRQHPHPRDVDDLLRAHGEFTKTLNGLGIQVGGGQPAEFTGKLPDELATLVEYGADEKLVRQLAALQAVGGQPAAQRQQPAQQQPAQQQPAEERQQAPVDDPDRDMWLGKISQLALKVPGTNPQTIKQALSGTLLPIVFNELIPAFHANAKGNAPAALAIWKRMSLGARHQLLSDALASFQAKIRTGAPAKPTPKQPVSPPLRQQQDGAGGQNGRQSTLTHSQQRIQSNLDRMRGAGG